MRRIIVVAISTIAVVAPAPALAAKHHVCHKRQHHHHCARHKKAPAKSKTPSPVLAPASTAAPVASGPLPPSVREIGPEELEWGEVPVSEAELEAIERETPPEGPSSTEIVEVL